MSKQLFVTDTVTYTVDIDDVEEAMSAFLLDPDKYLVAVVDRYFTVCEDGQERNLTDDESDAICALATA